MELTNRQLADLRYLRQQYGWDDRDARDVMNSIRATKHGAHYYCVLAAAHRAGYEQTQANGFIRLEAWVTDQGLPNPFGPAFDIAVLDALAIETRKLAA